MDKDSLLKEGLDKINEGLDSLDKYLDEVAKTKTQDEIKIALGIDEVCKTYHDLCECVKEIYKKKLNKESKQQ